MYDYECIEMKTCITRLFHWYYVGGTIAKSRKDENIYNVMRQLVESNFVVFCLFFFLFE